MSTCWTSAPKRDQPAFTPAAALGQGQKNVFLLFVSLCVHCRWALSSVASSSPPQCLLTMSPTAPNLASPTNHSTRFTARLACNGMQGPDPSRPAGKDRPQSIVLHSSAPTSASLQASSRLSSLLPSFSLSSVLSSVHHPCLSPFFSTSLSLLDHFSDTVVCSVLESRAFQVWSFPCLSIFVSTHADACLCPFIQLSSLQMSQTRPRHMRYTVECFSVIISDRKEPANRL